MRALSITEISNFSKPGFESRHNLMYWDNAEYYGLGAGASGYVDGIRYKNHGPIRHYMQAVEEGNARVQEEHLTPDRNDGGRDVSRTT